MKKKYSILVNTCDSYSDAWPMFFHLLMENWVGDFPKIYINTESNEYISEVTGIDIVTLNHKDTESWGDRLLKCLEKIPDEYILMMLEDFYYENTIKTSIIDDCVLRMEEDKNIMAFELVPCGEVSENPSIKRPEPYQGFAERRRFSTFRLVACPTLWRRSDLIRVTMKNDNPWEWEYFGSFRTWFYYKKIYSWKSKEDRIFDYDIDHGGAIHRGKWVGYKLMELEKKYDFKLDYGNREVENDWMKNPAMTSVPPVYKRIGSVFRNRTKMVKEIIRGAFL